METRRHFLDIKEIDKQKSVLKKGSKIALQAWKKWLDPKSISISMRETISLFSVIYTIREISFFKQYIEPKLLFDIEEQARSFGFSIENSIANLKIFDPKLEDK